MNDSSRFENLVTSLGMEILSSRAGSQDGQFPILDILGNLRDEAQTAGKAEMKAICEEGWDRMVGIVESGKAFTAEDVQWLKDLLVRIQKTGEANARRNSEPISACPGENSPE